MCVLSDSTAVFILSKFNSVSFNYTTDDHLKEFVLAHAAKIRFLVKFHKTPIGYRQVENDSRSLLTPMAIVVGKFLNKIQAKIETCARDSRSVICKYIELNSFFRESRPHYRIFVLVSRHC